MRSKITAHVIVKNEEYFVFEAIRSAIEYVDRMIIFDTGSTDATVQKIKDAVHGFEERVTFKEKGPCDRKRHTELRQEMLEMTNTEWFFILDGDEVYHERGMEEICSLVKSAGQNIECLIVPFHLCVGDAYHRSTLGQYSLFGKTGHFSVRLCRIARGIHWHGAYNQDTLLDSEGKVFFQEDNTLFVSEPYWHVSHLPRSPNDAFSSNGDSRKSKQLLTFTFIGSNIRHSLPRALGSPMKLSVYRSILNLITFVSTWSIKKCMKLFGKKA